MIRLILIFFKIGIFGFGGGWSIIGLIQKELVDNKLLTYEDFINGVGIAQLTPGPIALNMATYTGFKLYGILGAIFATLSLLAPTVIVLILAILLFDRFFKSKNIIIVSLSGGAILLMLYSLIRMVQNSIGDYKLFVIASISFLLFLKGKIHPVLIIIFSSILYYLFDSLVIWGV